MDHDPQAQQLHHQHHLHHHHGGPPQPPPGMIFPPGNSYHHHPQHHQSTANMSNNAPPQMIASNSPAFLQNNRFPFNSIVPTTPVSKPLESLNPGFSVDGMLPSSGDGGFAIDSAKKKRGRPRKYSPDGGNIALGLSPTPISTAIVPADSSGGTPSSETPSSSKKHRGRPPGSGKKQLDALGNCGVGFTPHVILVKAGEDIASKIMAFAQQGPRTVCIMSANGSICNVTLRQSATSDANVTYEGRFEIISLTGSFLLSDSESGGNQVRTGGMNISLAGPDGRVVGGGVSGMLVAATPVQIIVGSFVANGKKPKYMPSVPESRMLHFGAPSSAVSPPSQEEEPSTESSEEEENNNNNNNNNMNNNNGNLNANGHVSNIAPGPFNHIVASPQQIHNLQQQQHQNQHQQQQQQQMFNQMAWPNPGNTKMHHQ